MKMYEMLFRDSDGKPKILQMSAADPLEQDEVVKDFLTEIKK